VYTAEKIVVTKERSTVIYGHKATIVKRRELTQKEEVLSSVAHKATFLYYYAVVYQNVLMKYHAE